jgi:hypothetical protein
MPVMSARLTGRPASRRISAQHCLPARLADHHQVAGIDRHAEMLDLAADRFQRRGDDVAAVGDGRRAEHDDQFGTGLEHFVDGFRQRCLLVRHALFGDDCRAGRRDARGRNLQRLFDHLGRKPRQQRRDHADLLDLVGRDADDRLRFGRGGDRLVARTFRHRKGDDLHRRDHLAFDHGLERRQRGERHRLVDAVEIVDCRLVHHQHASGLRKQIAASGKRPAGAQARPGNSGSNIGSGLILGDVPRLDTGDDDLLDAGRLQRRDLLGADQRALLEHQVALADGMHRGRAERLLDGNGAELHAASASFSAFCRSVCVISAMMASAISAGDTAPIGSPMGA